MVRASDWYSEGLGFKSHRSQNFSHEKKKKKQIPWIPKFSHEKKKATKTIKPLYCPTTLLFMARIECTILYCVSKASCFSALSHSFVDSAELDQESCDVRENVKRKFLVEMPEDFYQFWDFCKSLNPSRPESKISSYPSRPHTVPM